ncbi:MAG TPA: FUSC family protein [Candidatus Aquilonibacter sp.]|nr:FUSC family protein [Candidatus Aquilonibacter sp.]
MPSLSDAEKTESQAIISVLVHSTRTTMAVIVSLLVARLCRLPEFYWAPITTIVITQSSLGAALKVSWQRFIGTALGAAVGAIAVSRFGTHLWVLAVGIFVLGPLCFAIRADRSAYRFGGIALMIVLLTPHVTPAWRTAFDRFAEVSIGIGVALLLTLVWPEKEPTPST